MSDQFGQGGFKKSRKMTLQKKIERREKVNAAARKNLGARVCTMDQLQQLAECKSSVFHTGCWGLLPAVVVMNMTASSVLRAIQNKSLFEYQKPTKNELRPQRPTPA